MKTMHIPIRAIAISSLFFLTGMVYGQSVTMGPIPGTSFCAGDPISVSFTASGFFGHKNAFDLQLSDPTGSFANGFMNIGSIMDTLPGTFTIITTIPPTITASIHYRFRILAAIPYISSADNGKDIPIGVRPTQLEFLGHPKAAEIGVSVSFSVLIDGANSSDSVLWDFGSGANPASKVSVFNDRVQDGNTMYSTAGDKTISLSVVSPGGCSKAISYAFHVYDCSTPHIPHNAKVVDSSSSSGVSHATFWVNPGVTLSLSGNEDTIFAEPGSTIQGASGCILYMKRGAVYGQPGYGNIVIYADGASVLSHDADFTFSCPTLDFDYTNAPPNAAHPLGVASGKMLTSITLSPNPTTGIVNIQGLPPNLVNVSILNVLGESVMDLKNVHSPDFSFDLSKFVRGTYYVRFATANSVVTKMVVRE